MALQDRFWAKVDRRSPEECWAWLGSTSRGYGHITVDGRGRKATHVALELDGRPRRNGDLALHGCDNPLCVNPAHLRWGTYADNTADKIARRRARSGVGERHGRAKLSADDVRRIRDAKRNTGELPRLRQELGVSKGTTDKIRNGVTWRHV